MQYMLGEMKSFSLLQADNYNSYIFIQYNCVLL